MASYKVQIDLTKFKNLLQKSENSGGRGRFLSQPEYQNLLDMEKKLIAHYYFENKQKYFELFNDYIDQKLSLRQFQLIFLQVWKSDQLQAKKALEKCTFQEGLDFIWFDAEAENITALLIDIFRFCSRLETEAISFKLDYLTEPNKKFFRETSSANMASQVTNLINEIKRICNQE